MKSSKFSYVILLVAGLNSALSAQDGPRENSIEKGAWSLQFQISNNFTLRSFDGSVLSAKYHFSKTRALRVGLGLDLLVSERGRSVDARRDTLFQEFDDEVDTHQWGFDIAMQYLFYPVPDGDIHLFFGGGPMFGYEKGDSETNRTVPGEPPDLRSTNEVSFWRVGVTGALGAEWFVTRQISLLAEYGFFFRYQWAESVQTSETGDQTTTEVEDSETFNVNASQVRLGLSVYF